MSSVTLRRNILHAVHLPFSGAVLLPWLVATSLIPNASIVHEVSRPSPPLTFLYLTFLPSFPCTCTGPVVTCNRRTE
ncbi:hypothetical protein PAXINDRAFT_171749 [Paxillus involutus ATCC 200175]|uniref:Uncharacterized protein n=1 Tax=Paxillus involutus ATCC 200175 TaxID=664439 RepID=A0A0C9TUQ8_PAXIN|nr:hypothetical protein PAXINDRAFT_171749 [Paxillus involutus ATCC 200175]